MMYESFSPSDDDPDLSEVCLVGGDLTDFNCKRIGLGLRKLDLSFNMIQRVKGLESSADTLEEIILDNNQLHRIELHGNYPKLHTLSANKNLISDFTPLLNVLKRSAPVLRYLSLLGNPGCPDSLTADDVNEADYQEYRHFVIHHLPGLRFLDHKPVTHFELFESQRSTHAEIRYLYTTPLSKITLKSKKSELGVATKTKQGKRKYKYLGKNSEGNRFIKDSDL